MEKKNKIKDNVDQMTENQNAEQSLSSQKENLKNRIFSELMACRACATTVSDSMETIMALVDEYGRSEYRRGVDDFIEQHR